LKKKIDIPPNLLFGWSSPSREVKSKVLAAIPD